MKVTVIECRAFGKAFENLTPGSVHEVIKIKNTFPGSGLFDVWVRGVGDNVKLLNKEFKWANGSTDPSRGIECCADCTRVYGSCQEWRQFDKCPLGYVSGFNPD